MILLTQSTCIIVFEIPILPPVLFQQLFLLKMFHPLVLALLRYYLMHILLYTRSNKDPVRCFLPLPWMHDSTLFLHHLVD